MTADRPDSVKHVHHPITSAQVFSRGSLVGSVNQHARRSEFMVTDFYAWCHECDFKSTWHHYPEDALLALAQHLSDAHKAEEAADGR